MPVKIHFLYLLGEKHIILVSLFSREMNTNDQQVLELQKAHMKELNSWRPCCVSWVCTQFCSLSSLSSSWHGGLGEEILTFKKTNCVSQYGSKKSSCQKLRYKISSSWLGLARELFFYWALVFSFVTTNGVGGHVNHWVTNFNN